MRNKVKTGNRQKMAHYAQQFSQWEPSSDFTTIKTLDCHTGGEPLRIVTDGFPELIGNTVLEKRRYCQSNFDHLRTALMFEPKGHADMYGAIVVAPENDDSHFGAIFIHNEGYSSMCGHATIALAKFAVECGLVPVTGSVTEIKIDAPCGQITAYAYCDEKRVAKVSFDCVPSYTPYLDQVVKVPSIGEVKFDLAFGGAYYAYVDANSIGLECTPAYYNQMIDYGRKIKQAVAEQYPIKHPFEDELSFLYGTIFIDKSSNSKIHSRNVCIFADGEVDRSPTGSGVSGRAAIHFAKNQLTLNQPIIIESILGSQFDVEVIREVDYAGNPAVIPRVTGQAFITGKNEFIIDPLDPLRNGFIFR